MSKIQIQGWSSPPIPTQSVDNNPPTVFQSALTASLVTTSSMYIEWLLATDVETDNDTIFYTLYQSDSSNIGSVSNMKANGTPIFSASNASASLVTGLSDNTTYYHNVIARDTNDNELGYTQLNTTTNSTASADSGSKALDEATLEALAGTIGGLGTGWATSGMDLDTSIDGVTVENIGGENRVTEIDLRNRGLTGDINITEWENLKELVLVNVAFNNLNSQIPQQLVDLGENSLRYLYLCMSDDVETDLRSDQHPHEEALDGGGDIHPGKDKGAEDNIYTGAFPTPSNPANNNIEWIVCNWTDSAEDAQDGISSIPSELFDITSLVCIHFFDNGNITPFDFPTAVTNMMNLEHFAIGVQNAARDAGPLTGTVPADLFTLSKLKYVRLRENVNLTLDMDILNFAPSGDFIQLVAPFIDIRGTSMPSEFFDGRFPELTGITINWPEVTGGVGGAFPEVDQSLVIKIFQFRNNSLTSLPASLWSASGAIIQPEFGDNNLTTIGTNDISNQFDLRYLRLSNNDLYEDWPLIDFTESFPNEADMANNKYVFRHMLYVPSGESQTILQLYQNVFGSVFYSPQKNFGFGNEISGNIIDLSAVVNHSDNNYQWQKDGSDLAGETSNILDTSAYGAGTYRLEVTNPGAPLLTLTSISYDIE